VASLTFSLEKTNEKQVINTMQLCVQLLYSWKCFKKC